MTKLLEQAIERVKQLPETEQDAIAALILEYILSVLAKIIVLLVCETKMVLYGTGLALMQITTTYCLSC